MCDAIKEPVKLKVDSGSEDVETNYNFARGTTDETGIIRTVVLTLFCDEGRTFTGLCWAWFSLRWGSHWNDSETGTGRRQRGLGRFYPSNLNYKQRLPLMQMPISTEFRNL